MESPPAKRRKRLVVLSFDDDAGSIVSRNPTAASEGGKTRTASNGASMNGDKKQLLPTRSRKKAAELTPSTLTEKTDPHMPKKNPRNKAPSRSISTFFKPEPPEQRLVDASEQKRKVPKKDVVARQEEEQEEEDAIEDDSPVEGLTHRYAMQDTTKSVLDRRKQQLPPSSSYVAPALQGRPPSGSQKFKIATNGDGRDSSAQTATAKEQDLKPWAERFPPNTLEELAVHKRKISDVQTWLANVLSGKERKSLLILKGPSGAGKTATIAMLAKTMGFDLVEWRNPVGSEFSSEGYLSLSAQFEDFLGRSGRFNKLDLERVTRDTASPCALPSSPQPENARRKVILLEEFPNTFLSTSIALRSFRSSILEYLATYTPSMGPFYSRNSALDAYVKPMVMIITETRLATTTVASDNFTAHRLLGSDILNHPGVSTIDFNPVASTYLTKALELVLQKEARQSGRRRIPGPCLLKILGTVGDVRSGISSLEFLCVRGEDGDDWSGRVAANAKKGHHASTALTKMEQESLQMVTQRESSLSLFHAVGKVVYNKRDATPGEGRVSQVAVDQLMDETGTDTGTFIAALHENYVMSCEGPSFSNSLDQCIDTLSDSDLLDPHGGGRFSANAGRTFQGAASDTLRQDEIAFQIAVRGLLFSLPDPVKRAAYPTGVPGRRGGKSDAHKMFYPTSIRLARQMEDISSSVERYMDRLRGSSTLPGQSTTKHGHQRFLSKYSSTQPNSQTPDSAHTEPSRTTLTCTNTELILERLPYITQISRQNQSPHLRELEKITQFHGIEAPGDDASSSEEENATDALPVAEWTTDQAAEEKVPGTGVPSLHRSVTGAGKDGGAKGLGPAEEEVGKLYLSEDDIEDE